MRKYLIFSMLILFVGIANARDPKILAIDVGLLGQFPSAWANPVGIDAKVAINTITVNRTQPAQSGDVVANMPEKYKHKQIGVYTEESKQKPGVYSPRAKKNSREYHIILEGSTVEQFARDLVTLAFNFAGYEVVAGGDDVPSVDVDLTALWMWVQPIARNRKQFHFAVETKVSSDTPELANIGTVRGAGFRNGSRPTSKKSYRNTVLHSVKSYFTNFENRLEASADKAQ
jgi:hypothetical protein